MANQEELDLYRRTYGVGEREEMSLAEDLVNAPLWGIEKGVAGFLDLADELTPFYDWFPDDYQTKIRAPDGIIGQFVGTGFQFFAAGGGARSVVSGLVKGITRGAAKAPGVGKHVQAVADSAGSTIDDIAGYVKYARVARKAGAKGRLSKEGFTNLARASLEGGYTAALVFDGNEGRLTDMLGQLGVPTDKFSVTSWLESDEDDSELEGRLKDLVEGAFLGPPLEKVLGGAAAFLKGMRRFKKGDKKPFTEEDVAKLQDAEEAYLLAQTGMSEDEAHAVVALMDGLGLRDENGDLIEGFGGFRTIDDLTDEGAAKRAQDAIDDAEAQGKYVRGSTLMDAGRRVILLTQRSDVSTAAHEMAHVLRMIILDNPEFAARRGIDSGMLSVIAREAGALVDETGGYVYDEAAEERFARMFERYLLDGATHADESMQGILDRLSQYMVEVYERLYPKGELHPDMRQASPEMRAVFDQLIDRTKDVDVGPVRPGDPSYPRNANPRQVEQPELEFGEKYVPAGAAREMPEVPTAYDLGVQVPEGLEEGARKAVEGRARAAFNRSDDSSSPPMNPESGGRKKSRKAIADKYGDAAAKYYDDLVDAYGSELDQRKVGNTNVDLDSPSEGMLFQVDDLGKSNDGNRQPKLTPEQAALRDEVVFKKGVRDPERDFKVRKGLNPGNIDSTIEELDGVARAFPDPMKDEDTFQEMLDRTSTADKVLRAPTNFIREVNSGETNRRLRDIPQRVKDRVDEGFKNIKIAGRAVRKDKSGRKLMMALFWSRASLRASPFNQEAAFLEAVDTFAKHLDDAMNGRFNIEAYDAQIRKHDLAARTGSPGSSIQMQLAGRKKSKKTGKWVASGPGEMLTRINNAALGGDDLVKQLHNVWFDDALNSRQVMRQVWKVMGGQGFGMDNKLLRFARLATGFDDVIIIDAIQQQAWFDMGKKRIAQLNKQVSGKRDLNLADTQGEIDSFGTKGGVGMALYEGLERSLDPRLAEIFEGTGMEPSMGRLHWALWVLNGDEPSEIAHETLQWFAKGGDYDKGIREGRYNEKNFGVVYNDKKYWVETPLGLLSFDRARWAEVRDGMFNKASGVLRRTKILKEDGNERNWNPDDRFDRDLPWVEDTNVNQEGYALYLAVEADGVTFPTKDGGSRTRTWTSSERAAIGDAHRQAVAANVIQELRYRRSRGEGEVGSSAPLAGGEGENLEAWLRGNAPKAKAVAPYVKSVRKVDAALARATKIERMVELEVSPVALKKYGIDVPLDDLQGETVRIAVGVGGNQTLTATKSVGNAFVITRGSQIIAAGGNIEQQMAMVRHAIEEFDARYMLTNKGGMGIVSANGGRPVAADADGNVYMVFDPENYSLAFSDLKMGLPDPKVLKDPARSARRMALEIERRAEADGLLFQADELPLPDGVAPPAPMRGSQRRKDWDRTPELEVAANRFAAGDLSREEYDQAVRELRPVRVLTQVPRPLSNTEVKTLLGKKSSKGVNITETLAEGQRVDMRVDVNAWTAHRKMILTAHKPVEGDGVGSVLGYDTHVALRNVRFGVGSLSQKDQAFKIAKGESRKFPFAVMKGENVPMTAERAAKDVEKYMAEGAESEWTQVGFDPRRHAYFYDRETLTPVMEAAEVVQFQEVVYARGLKFGKKEDFLFQADEIDERFLARRREPRDPEDILNLDRMDSDRGVARAFEEVLRHAKRDGAHLARRTLQEAREESEKIYREMMAEQGNMPSPRTLRRLRSDNTLATMIRTSSAQLMAARETLARVHREYLRMLEGAGDLSLAEDAVLLELRRKWELVGSLNNYVQEAKAEFGRALGDLRYRPDGTGEYIDIPTRLTRENERVPGKANAPQKGTTTDVPMPDAPGTGVGPERATGASGSDSASGLPDPIRVDKARTLPDVGGRAKVVRELNKTKVLLEEMRVTGNMEQHLPKPGMMGMLVEYFVNNILFGLKTHIVNISGNAINTIYAPLERAMGATLAGQFSRSKSEIAELFSTLEFMKAGLRQARKAAAKDMPLLTQERKLDAQTTNVRSISSKAQGVDPDTLEGMMLDGVGKFINLPGRGLVAADEMFKVVTYLRRLKRNMIEVGLGRFPDDPKAAMTHANKLMDAALNEDRALTKEGMYERGLQEAKEAGLKSTAARNYASNYVVKYWDTEVGSAVKDAVQEARKMTWTSDIDQGVNRAEGRPQSIGQRLTGGYGLRGTVGSIATVARDNILRNHPYLSMFVPFITTPTNIMQWTLDRSLGAVSDAGGMLYAKMRGEMLDPAAKADLYGRMATGVALFGVGGMYALSLDDEGRPFITGSGPDTEGERNVWKANGIQPFSILVDGKYISYKRMEPYSTHIALMADMMQHKRDLEAQGEGFSADRWAGAWLAGVAESLKDKTYLQGISDILSAIEDGSTMVPRMAQNFGGSLFPAAGLFRQNINPGTGLAAEHFKEVRALWDGPGGNLAAGFMRTAPGGEQVFEPRRNLYGEPIKKSTYFGPNWLSPFEVAAVSDDQVANEFYRVGYNPEMPREAYKGADWVEYRSTSGQTAYDRFHELHGEVKLLPYMTFRKVRMKDKKVTMQEAHRMLIESDYYQSLSPAGTEDNPSPRIALLQRVTRAYRKAAEAQTLQEYPELAQEFERIEAERNALKRGLQILK